jgi:hypothetical protein
MMPEPIETQEPQFVDDEQPEFGQGEVVYDMEDGSNPAQHEAAEKLKQVSAEQLQNLGHMILAKFNDSEIKRQYIETRWLEDLRQYHGRYDPSIEKELDEAESCALFLNITKPKTHAFSARVMDMVLPTDEKNWGMENTPVPEMVGKAQKGALPEAVAGTTNPETGALEPTTTPENNVVLQTDIERAVKEEAASRCEDMESEVEDQLTEANVNAVQRKAIEQMAKLGTGIVMGPAILDEWRVTWKPQERMGVDGQPNGYDYVRTLVKNTDMRPGLQWVDCWNFYPDMSSEAPEDWEFAFVQYLVNKATFRKYAKRFNFIPAAVERALEQAPFNVHMLRWMTELRQLSETSNIIDQRYRLLRYYGELTADDLRAVDMEPDAMGVSDVVMGVVWICGGEVLKVDINPLDSGSMPFNVCYCDKDEASPFGTGIPRLMRGEQDSVNAAWRMKHDNAGLSVCPQTVMRANAVTPADGDYHMKPKKLWYVADDVARVGDVFAQFSIDSHQAELDNILQLAIRFADDVTQLPLIMQGEMAPHITQTAQGMSLLYNASTVVLRRTVKFFDDYMTIPLINKFYEWNMQFNPRDDIKGDFRSVARGSSTLLDKEQQGQALSEAMAIAMQPTWQPYTDMKKLYQQALKAKRIQDIILPDEEIKKNLDQQQQAAAAQAAGAQGAQAGPAGPDPNLEQAKLAMKQAEIDARNRQTESQERIAVARIASDQKISLEQAQARLAGIKIGKDVEAQMFNSEMDTKLKMGTGI